MTQTLDCPLPWKDQPYSVKRFGLTITNCDSEPVQTPGCIQAHGALLVLRRADFSILQVSENTQEILGYATAALLSQPASTVIGIEGEAALLALLEQELTDHNPLYLLTLPASEGSETPLDVMVHTTDGVVVLEFESTGRTGTSRPDYYALVRTTVARLQTAASLQDLCNLVVSEIRDLTGQDRVMVYKFHADGHGEVVAESRRADLNSWLGLHYPAEDIPKPAREMFTKTWIRPVPDVSGALAELLPLTNPDTGRPLDMTYCALRGVSVMYTEYLHNMGVAAALTMAIRKNESVWGLIACHHYTAPKHVSYQVRAASEFLAQVVTLQLQAAEAKEHAAYRLNMERVHQQLIAEAGAKRSLECFTARTFSLLDGIHAGGVALYHNHHWSLAGTTPDEGQLNALKAWLVTTRRESGVHAPYVTDHLASVYPGATAFAKIASGLIALPISLAENSMILWFRPETLQTINWGGDPHDKPLVDGPHGLRLSPRRSFYLFSESVRERSIPWLPVETQAAASLRMAVLDLLAGLASLAEGDIDTNYDMAHTNEELDAFAYVASHDLKEPLRGIHRYANELLENAELLSNESRIKLDSVVRLSIRMDGLLDSLLQFSRVGGGKAAFKVVDLNKTIADALEIVEFRTTDGHSILIPRNFPITRCNEVQCRQILVNLLSNALKYTDVAQKKIEIGFIEPAEIHGRPGCPQGSEADTIFYVADNGIGIEVKNFGQVFKLFKRLHGRNDYGGGTGAGLTIVRKLAGQHGGKVWVDSSPDGGATFYFTLSGNTASGNNSADQQATVP